MREAVTTILGLFIWHQLWCISEYWDEFVINSSNLSSDNCEISDFVSFFARFTFLNPPTAEYSVEL